MFTWTAWPAPGSSAVLSTRRPSSCSFPGAKSGVELGHRDGKCSFETIIEHYGLVDKGLLRLARIVHSADVEVDIHLDPIARGLEAIAVGYSLRFPNDQDNLQRQFDVYDALYAWCRLQVAKEG